VLRAEQVISRALTRPSGITTDVVYIGRRKTRVRPIRACVGPRYDRRDPARSDRVSGIVQFRYIV